MEFQMPANFGAHKDYNRDGSIDRTDKTIQLDIAQIQNLARKGDLSTMDKMLDAALRAEIKNLGYTGDPLRENIEGDPGHEG